MNQFPRAVAIGVRSDPRGVMAEPLPHPAQAIPWRIPAVERKPVTFRDTLIFWVPGAVVSLVLVAILALNASS